MNRSNSNSARAEQESIDAELPSDAYQVGVDEEGTEHWHSAYEGRLWLVQPDGDVQTTTLRRRTISQWVLFVEDRYGWQRRQPVEQANGLAEIADDILEGADA